MLSIQTQVVQIIAEKLGLPVVDIRLESRFIHDLGADSLNVVELMMAFEDSFAIEISDVDAEKIRTVQDVVDYLDKRLQTQPSP